MQLISAAFAQGKEIPTRFTCEGENVSPEFSWKEAPPETKSFALILHDPDAPRQGGFTHWVLYNIPGDAGHIEPEILKEENVHGTGIQGCNDGGEIGYTGPCPSSGTHRYYARLFALDTVLGLSSGATHEELTSAMDGHILAKAELMGTYSKKIRKVA